METVYVRIFRILLTGLLLTTVLGHPSVISQIREEANKLALEKPDSGSAPTTIQANSANEVTTKDPSSPKPDLTVGDYFDQRQNGSENYRIKLDGVVFLIAPIDTLLLAGAGLDQSTSSGLNESVYSDHVMPKPKPKPEIKEREDNVVKRDPAQKHGVRIFHLLAPLLQKIRH